MNKEQQDLAWSVLPKEFKNEVKSRYKNAIRFNEYAHECVVLRDLFGEDNLTSDAEGDEMLTVPRKTVQSFFMTFKREKSDAKSIFDNISLGARMSMLQELFSSKCLPDEEQIAENANCSNVDSLSQNPPENCNKANHISTDDNKPAEPKFKVGDKVKDISSPHDGGIYKVDDIKKSSNGFVYHIQGLIGKSNVKESDLEPYTEPTDHILQPSCQVLESAASTEPTDFGKEVNFPTKKESRNLSQNYDKQLDSILTGSFFKERRLNIAAQIARILIQGVNFLYTWSDEEIKGVAHNSMRFADALIAECQLTDKLKGE